MNGDYEHDALDLIDRYLNANPETRSQIEEEILALHEADPQRSDLAMAQCIASAQTLDHSPVDDGLLAWYISAVSLHKERLPEPLAAPAKRIEATIASDPEFAARANALSRRMAQLDGQTNAGTHLEDLTGRTLPVNRHRRRADRPEARRLRNRVARRSVTLLGIVGLLAGTLVLADQATRPAFESLAYREAAALPADAFEGRGATSASGAVAPLALFNSALADIQIARRTYAGLFPSYDERALQDARTKLERVIALETDATPLAVEARFFEGAVSLALGDRTGAIDAFEVVASANGPRREQAAMLVSRLRE